MDYQFSTVRPLDTVAARARYIRNRSKYMPHQGKREKIRRRIGGFADTGAAVQSAMMRHHPA